MLVELVGAFYEMILLTKATSMFFLKLHSNTHYVCCDHVHFTVCQYLHMLKRPINIEEANITNIKKVGDPITKDNVCVEEQHSRQQT
jgi:hypothetical protein